MPKLITYDEDDGIEILVVYEGLNIELGKVAKTRLST